ncbi:Vacuolar protein sorting-associated protein 35 [Entophlyctis luteolus]|nr:Vacuolar protein sorting-associated protein 35 [Entophlyctis luteolus]
MSATPSPSPSSRISPELPRSQSEILEEALGIVNGYAKNMRKCLDQAAVMDAFRYASLMLATLRTSLLTPKNYYELYMAIFDQLNAYLAQHLFDAHVAKVLRLSDLYELVQYAGNIVPRLYLMVGKKTFALSLIPAFLPQITVGAVYMRVASTTEWAPDEPTPPVKELLNDLLEMAKGVQHPTRGLFLRYYLSSMTRDYMPNHAEDGPLGSLDTSINFVLQNFIEMNKLWVRLQYIGHSSERDKRETERKELRVIVGSGLVRLSQLDGLGIVEYKTKVLPSLFGEIVSCKDPIAQEYLMDIIIQVFPEDFHFGTLDLILAATMQLTKVETIKQTVLNLMERFVSFESRAQAEVRQSQNSLEGTHGIPNDIPLFDLFWEQILALSAKPDFKVGDTLELLVAVENLCLKIFPDRMDRLDKILIFAKDSILASNKSLASFPSDTVVLRLLMAPLEAYESNPLIFLSLPSSQTDDRDSEIRDDDGHAYCGSYTELLRILPHALRRKIANSFARSVVNAGTCGDVDGAKELKIATRNAVEAVFGELCSVLVTDCLDGNVFGAFAAERFEENERLVVPVTRLLKLDWEDIVEEQNLMARMIHLVRSTNDSPDDTLELLAVLRHHLGTGGDLRIRFTLPPFVHACLSVVVGFLGSCDLLESDVSTRVLSLFHFITETISALARAKYVYSDSDDAYFDAPPGFGKFLPTPASECLRLFVATAACADSSGHIAAVYEMLIRALECYDEAVGGGLGAGADAQILEPVIGAIARMEVFGTCKIRRRQAADGRADNDANNVDDSGYAIVVERLFGCVRRLLRKQDQARLAAKVAALFWRAKTTNRCWRAQPTESAGSPTGTWAEADSAVVKHPELFGEDTAAATTLLANHGADGEIVGMVPFRDSARVLDCLQRSMSIANSVLDPSLRLCLFVFILEQYLLFYHVKVDSISMRHISSLIELIHTSFSTYEEAASKFASVAQKGRSSIFAGHLQHSKNEEALTDKAKRHFRNILSHLQKLNAQEESVIGGDENVIAVFLSHVVPWLVAIPVSAGEYLTFFNVFTSLVFVSTANFIIPLIVYIQACGFRQAYNNTRVLTENQLKILKAVHYQSKTINTFIDNYDAIRNAIGHLKMSRNPSQRTFATSASKVPGTFRRLKPLQFVEQTENTSSNATGLETREPNAMVECPPSKCKSSPTQPLQSSETLAASLPCLTISSEDCAKSERGPDDSASRDELSKTLRNANATKPIRSSPSLENEIANASSSALCEDTIKIIASIEPYLLEDVPDPLAPPFDALDMSGENDRVMSAEHFLDVLDSTKTRSARSTPNTNPASDSPNIKLHPSGGISSCKDGSRNSPASKLGENELLTISRMNSSNQKSSDCVSIANSQKSAVSCKVSVSFKDQCSATNTGSCSRGPNTNQNSLDREKNCAQVAEFRNSNFPVQTDFVSPPFSALPKWMGVSGRFIALTCLLLSSVASILGLISLLGLHD